MSPSIRLVGLVAPVVGAALVATQILLFPLLLEHCDRDRLEVRVDAPAAARSLSVSAQLPAGISERAEVWIDGKPGDLGKAAPVTGLRRVDWKVAYRGGFERAVGLTQLVGPFQDPDNPPCSVRLLIGQNFLDDGMAGPGTVANLAKGIMVEQLSGMSQWPIGSFLGVSMLSLQWSSARGGALEIEVEAIFEKGDVPMKLVVVPELREGKISLRAYADADVDLDNRVYQWVADIFDADEIAGATAEYEIKQTLRDAFRPPPPVPLPGGRRLVFDYCPHQDIEVLAKRYAAVPLMMRIEGGQEDILPVSFGPVMKPPIAETSAPLSLEFNLDAINAVLYYLWHSGFLDEELSKSGVEQRFNTDSAVRDLLSIRISEIRLALPPTLSVAPTGASFDFGAATTLMITDGTKKTPARLYGSVGLDFAAPAKTGSSDERTKLRAQLSLRDLALSCEPEPGLLRPCYSDLVSEAAGRADQLHGVLSRLFTDKFNQIVLGRSLGSDETLADFHIDRAEVQTKQVESTALLRVDLFGSLRSRP